MPSRAPLRPKAHEPAKGKLFGDFSHTSGRGVEDEVKEARSAVLDFKGQSNKGGIKDVATNTAATAKKPSARPP